MLFRSDNNSQLNAETALELNYNNKKKLKSDNKLEMRLGFRKSKNDELHKFKTYNDLIRLTNKVNLQAIGNWDYSFQVISNTQFYKGYKSNDPKVYSDFMSPFTMNISLGMEYKLRKNKFNLAATISPIAYNFRYVDRMAIVTTHGLRPRHSTKSDFGPSIKSTTNWQVANNLSWSTRFFWYSDLSSNYFELESTIKYKFMKYLSAEIFLYPRIDDRSKNYKNEKNRYFMFREWFSLGFDYSM